MNTITKPKHIGRNICRIRELRDMKQEALAHAVGVTQQSISFIENSEVVDEERLAKIADALGVSVEAIKNFNDDALITYFNNFYDNASGQVGNHGASNITFNPIEKMVELFEENKQLYERLLKAEQDKVTYLEKLLEDK